MPPEEIHLEIDRVDAFNAGGTRLTTAVYGEDNTVLERDDLLILEVKTTRGDGGVEASTPQVHQDAAELTAATPVAVPPALAAEAVMAAITESIIESVPAHVKIPPWVSRKTAR
jgi:hypothetical protein